MAETCPNAELCCICKEPSHRAWFCRFSWYCDVSPTSSPAPQCQDTRQDTHQDTSRDMPLVANPPDPRPSSVPPSDSQPPLPARTPRTFLTPKVFSFSVICLVMMMTSPVFFQIVRSTLLMMIARIIMLMTTMMRMMMLMVMIITTMKIMMMITMVMIWSLPKPVYLSLPLLALTQLLSVRPSLPLLTLFLPPGDREFASAEPADDSPADVTPMESQPLLSSTESEPLGFSVLQDPKPQHSKSRFGLIRCSICCVEIQRRCLRP